MLVKVSSIVTPISTEALIVMSAVAGDATSIPEFERLLVTFVTVPVVALLATVAVTEKVQVSVAAKLPPVSSSTPLAKPKLEPVPHGFVGRDPTETVEPRMVKSSVKRKSVRLIAPLAVLAIVNSIATSSP